jgi:phage/plasmid-like protein (TIGR03299 family)
MAHELDKSNGKDAMAYVGERAWHGLGQELTEDADIETWKVEAGMNWEVKTSPVLYTAAGIKQPQTMPGRKLFYRSDNNAALAVVSSNFKVVQPQQTLEFYRGLVGTAGFKLETAGVLFGGRKFWALAKCGKDVRLMGQDVIKPYLLLATACDGSMSTCAHFTSVRVVCNNTLRMSIGTFGQRAQVKVPHHAAFDPDSVKRQLGIAKDAWSAFIGNITTLAQRSINRDDAIDLVAAALKADWHDQEGNELNREEQLESSLALRNIIRLFDGDAKGAQYRSSNGTMWGLLNAVTEYCDHDAGSKNGDLSRAFERAHLTDRATFKVRVANELLKVAA